MALLAIAGEYFSGVDGAGILCVVSKLYGFDKAKSEAATRHQRISVDHLPDAPDGVVGSAQVSARELRDWPREAARQASVRTDDIQASAYNSSERTL